MVMLIEFRGDCFVRPAEWCKLDLDSERDLATFKNIDWTTAAQHLYEGETIEIRCIKRED